MPAARPTLERFLEKVGATTPTGCIEWTAYRQPRGYGAISVGAKQELAHRVSWMLHNGPIPSGMHVLHKCDNQPCVNPEHLFIGTHADNMRDRSAKGRAYTGKHGGDLSGTAKLTWPEVRSIRALAKGGQNHHALAPRFGVKPGTILSIIRHKTWKEDSAA